MFLEVPQGSPGAQRAKKTLFREHKRREPFLSVGTSNTNSFSLAGPLRSLRGPKEHFSSGRLKAKNLVFFILIYLFIPPSTRENINRTLRLKFKYKTLTAVAIVGSWSF